MLTSGLKICSISICTVIKCCLKPNDAGITQKKPQIFSGLILKKVNTADIQAMPTLGSLNLFYFTFSSKK